MPNSKGLVSWRNQAPPIEMPAQSGALRCVVAIPARDEAALIARCLNALAEQNTRTPFAVVLFLNNCTDATADVVRGMADALPYPLYVHEAQLPPELSDAAWARRLAVNAACALASADGVVLSTDADSYAASTWISECEDAFAHGADVVCGFVAPDFTDAPSLDFESLRQGAMEYEYSQLATELVALVDPDPRDPWPRHKLETGANLGVRTRVLRALDGIPHICPGEDLAFVRMARRAGFTIRHAFRPHVTTSSRIDGRASGGWSADLRARATNTRGECHETLEPAARIMRRTLLRVKMREAYGTSAFRAHTARMVRANEALGPILDAPTFEQAWGALEDASSLLRQRPLMRTTLEANLVELRTLVERWRAQTGQHTLAPISITAPND